MTFPRIITTSLSGTESGPRRKPRSRSRHCRYAIDGPFGADVGRHPIGYAREDRTRVRSLAKALSAHGWSVWWDSEIQAGKRFSQVIEDALASARCVVVVWSHQSIASDWVREEADDGRRRGILIPVLIDDTRPPLGFRGIQAVELGDWSGSTTSEAFQKLTSDIAAILGSPSRQGSVTNALATTGLEAGAAPSAVHGRRRRIDVDGILDRKGAGWS